MDRKDTTLDFIGAEFETTNTDPMAIKTGLSKLGIAGYFTTDRDASSETFLKQLTSKLLFIDPQNVLRGIRGVKSVTTGLEFISTPLAFNEAESVIPKFLGELSRLGELEKASRSAFHVHIGFPVSLGTLKAAITFSSKFESLFYQIGTMGYTFRGNTNNAIYCRPHTGWGPPVVRCDDGNYRQILTYESLLAAKSVDEFWKKYRVNQMEPKRYHPSRYFALNIYSVLLHKTLEFRHFNISLNPPLVLAVMRLCQSTAEMLTRVPIRRLEELPANPVTKSNDDLQLLEILFSLLDEFSSTYPVPARYKAELRDLLCVAPKFILPEVHVKSHLFEKYVMPMDYYERDSDVRIPSAQLVDSGFLDSHQDSVRNISYTDIVSR